MLKYSQKSLDEFETLDPDLQLIFFTVLQDGFDHSIVVGNRGEEAQNEAVRTGRSTKRFPFSRHNKLPSQAADAMPYPVEWSALDAKDPLAIIKCGIFAGYVLKTADMLYKQGKIKKRLIWGGDWNRNWDVRDQNFNDWPHYELTEEEA